MTSTGRRCPSGSRRSTARDLGEFPLATRALALIPGCHGPYGRSADRAAPPLQRGLVPPLGGGLGHAKHPVVLGQWSYCPITAWARTTDAPIGMSPRSARPSGVVERTPIRTTCTGRSTTDCTNGERSSTTPSTSRRRRPRRRRSRRRRPRRARARLSLSRSRSRSRSTGYQETRPPQPWLTCPLLAARLARCARTCRARSWPTCRSRMRARSDRHLAVCQVGRVLALSPLGVVDRPTSSTPRHCLGRNLGHGGRHDVGRVRCHCLGGLVEHGDRHTLGHVVGRVSRSRCVSAAPNPSVTTGRQDTSTTTGHGARVACAALSTW